MTTYVVNAFNVSYNPTTGEPESISPTTVELAFSEGINSFSYSVVSAFNGFDLPVVSIDDGHSAGEQSSVRIAGMTFPEFSEFYIGAVSWTSGTSYIASIEDWSGTGITDTIFQIGGVPLPNFTSTSQFQLFGQTVTYVGQITSGPFAPGQQISVATLPGVTTRLADIFDGSSENDRFEAGAGNDTLFGYGGEDFLSGGAGNDLIDAGTASDWINTGGGSDTVDGGAGFDMLSFSDAPDMPGRTNVQYRLEIDMGAGTANSHDNSEQTQFSNIERLTGSVYADRIRGSDGNDDLRGLGDYDWFIATAGFDKYDGGTGQDMVSFVEWTSTRANVVSDIFSSSGAPPSNFDVTGVVVDFDNPNNVANLSYGKSLVSIERVTGSGRQDVFYGDDGQNDFRGLGDFDWFVSSEGGRERYFGGDGLDTVTYFNASAGIKASLSNGAIVNGRETGFGDGGVAARDLYFEIENLVGSRFDDSLTGSSERNQLNGLEGDDMIFGKGGVDYMMGGLGNDTIDGGAGSDYALFSGNADDYTLTRGTGSNNNQVTVVGADGTDALVDVEYFRFDDVDVTIWSL